MKIKNEIGQLKFLDMYCPVITENERPTLFSLAVDLTFADGELHREERNVIDMIANKELEKVENCKDAATISEETGNGQGSEEVDFKDMKVSELETYASEHGIDLTGAKTKEEKIALIKANESN